MILIGENIHVISKQIQSALIERDENTIIELLHLQSNMDFIDLNVGPAKGKLEGVLAWLTQIAAKAGNYKLSFDTTNIKEMTNALALYNGESFINSITNDEERLEPICDLAINNNSNLIALTLSKTTGIPKTADERLELAFEIYEKCLEKGIENEKLFFDPLILPVSVDQSQAIEAIHTIQMIKESFDPPVKTVIGLSNISNGAPKNMRPLINRVFASLAFGAGLDSAIIDAKDAELVRIIKMLEKNSPTNSIDQLYVNLAEMIKDFSELEEIEYNSTSKEESDIIKTARILLNKEIYTHSFTQI